jgi:hypothetical protein
LLGRFCSNWEEGQEKDRKEKQNDALQPTWIVKVWDLLSRFPGTRNLPGSAVGMERRTQ